MVHRWECRHCGYTVWSASRKAVADRIESHLLDHHRQQVERREFRIRWECPYCSRTGQSHDESEGVKRFRQHLFEHTEPLLESGTHVAAELGGSGSILVRTSLQSAGADNARVHFLSPGDLVMMITTTPGERIRLMHERLNGWPERVVILTTTENPLPDIDGVNVSDAPLEVVQLDRRLGLSALGETVSRVLDEQRTAGRTVSVEFDILSELIEKFELQTVFKFLHVLSQRLATVDALAHFYVDPTARSVSTVNILTELFDLSITAHGQVFVTDTGR